MIRLLLCAVVVLGFVTEAQAGSKAARRLKGKVILSQKPFPTSFKSDKAMVKHMKRIDTKRFKFNEHGKISVEIMAFFARAHTATEFTVTIYDVTERRRTVESFPIYPGQRSTQILASFVRLEAAPVDADPLDDGFKAERRYHLVVTKTYGGPVLAETTFAIKRGPFDIAREAKAKKNAPSGPVEF